MTYYKSPLAGIPITLQDAATATGRGLAIAIPKSFRRHKFTIRGNGAVGAGAIQFESASAVDYAGTWNPLGGGPVTVLAASELEYEFEGVYSALQARISTTVTVGTVTVTYVGMQ